MKNYLRTNIASAYAESDMAGVNAAGGIALWDLPPQFARAYNPIIYTRTRYLYVTDGYAAPEGVETLTNGTVTLYRNTEVDTATFEVLHPDLTGVTLSAESMDGVTTFDVAPVVRTWFNEQLADMTTPIVADGRLYTRYVVRNLGGTGWMRTCVAVNAVAQIGETSDMSEYIGKVLTDFTRVAMYDGYPLDYSLLAQSAVATSQGSTPPNSVSRVKVDGTRLELQTESGVPILTEDGEKIYLLPAFNIPVIWRCVPQQPFYVRWINRLGGVDYWMFRGRQVFEPSVKNSTLYERYTPNTATAKSNRQAYAIATDNTVTVGAQGLWYDDYVALRSLPFSPSIEWYNETLGTWIAITVAKYDGEEITRNSTRDIEITFALPAINTQF